MSAGDLLRAFGHAGDDRTDQLDVLVQHAVEELRSYGSAPKPSVAAVVR